MTARTDFTVTGADVDFENGQTDRLSGLALDAFYELNRLIADTGVTRLRVTLEWDGEY